MGIERGRKECGWEKRIWEHEVPPKIRHPKTQPHITHHHPHKIPQSTPPSIKGRRPLIPPNGPFPPPSLTSIADHKSTEKPLCCKSRFHRGYGSYNPVSQYYGSGASVNVSALIIGRTQSQIAGHVPCFMRPLGDESRWCWRD